MQRVQATLSQGVDGAVKTIYSPLPLLIEHHFFSGRPIVKSAHIVTANRPMKGLVAFVCARSAMKPFGYDMDALPLALPMSLQWLDRHEERAYPVEGVATP